MKISDAQSMAVMATLGLALGAAAYIILRGAKGTARDVVGGAASVIGDVATGTIEGLGQSIGIPVTNPDKCASAKAAGDTWEASKQCSAGDFAQWWWNK